MIECCYLLITVVKGKGSFYIAQYPVRWTAQSALHFSILPDRPVHSDTNSTSLGSILARQQLRATTKSLTLPPLSIARYNSVLIYTAESTRASMERMKMPNHRNGSKGDSKCIQYIYIVSPSVTTLPVYSYSCGPLLQDLSPWRRWPVWTSRSAAMVLPTGRRCLRVCAARWEGCLWTRGVTPPTTTPTSSSSRVSSSSGPSSCLCRWKSSRRCPSLPRGYVRSVDVSLLFHVGYQVDCC